MSNPFIPPSTPPRVKSQRQVVIKTPSTFQTPLTPVKITESLATPSTSGKNSRNVLRGTIGDRNNKGNLIPMTPDFTPHRSPQRSHKRKRSNVGAIFKQTLTDTTDTTAQRTPTTDLSGLLMPTPSTVGSGRKVPHGQTRTLRPPVLSFETLSKLNDNLNFEEEVDSEDVFKTSTPKLQSSFIQNSNLKLGSDNLGSNPSSPTRPSNKIRKYLQTPKGQLIDDETVNHWHGKSFNNNFSSDDEDFEDVKPTKMENPFLSTTNVSNKLSKSSNPFKTPNNRSESKNGANYDTHVEYFNNRTGEKKLVKLLSSQAQIKPKRLNFSAAIDGN